MEKYLGMYLAEKRAKRQSQGELNNVKWYVTPFCKVKYEEWPLFFVDRIENINDVSANKIYRYVRAFVNWLYSNKLVSFRITESFLVPQMPRKLPKSLSAEQIKVLLRTAIDHSFHARVIFSTYLYTGMRKTELIRIQDEDINLQEGIITVRGGKGKKDRQIPISLSLKAVLNVWELKRSNSPSYFCITNNGVYKMKREIESRLSFKFSLHMLRHSFATHLVSKGVDLIAVRDMLGHSTVKTTEIYLSTSPEHLKKEIDKLSF